MIPYTVNILGEVYTLYTSSEKAEYENTESSDLNVYLSPSLCSDFYISAGYVGENTLSEHYSAAFCAASFLFIKRGLPLDEISFETSFGNIQIFNTGSGILTAKLDKCKLLYTNTADVLGCPLDYADVDMGILLRTVKISSLDSADSGVIPPILNLPKALPAAAVLYERRGEALKFSLASSHSKHRVSRLCGFAAAALAEGECGVLRTEDGQAEFDTETHIFKLLIKSAD